MGVYVGMVAGLLGVVAIVAGVQGHGTALFSALSGLSTHGLGPAASSQPSGSAGAFQSRPVSTAPSTTPGAVAGQSPVTFA